MHKNEAVNRAESNLDGQSTVRFSEFISRDMSAILAVWDRFAASLLPAAADLDAVALRDHAEEILRAVIKDMESAQTPAEQVQKSEGRAPRLRGAPETAAETHAFLRAKSGFDMNQMASEYRALRASVLHLWAVACGPGAAEPEEITRFNEAIDQAVAESVAFFSAKITEERNLLLGMLGHDMRSPLHAIQVSAALLAKLNAGDTVAATAARIANSGAQLKSLLDDLIDFNRTNLGMGLHIAPVKVDLAHLFGQALGQLRASHPDREIELQVSGNVHGTWDPNRLHQLLGNLVSNALKYGAVDAPVKVSLSGMPAEVRFTVHNQGPMIEESALHRVFDPLVRGAAQRTGSASDGSLGLGLYIARQIAHAHCGDIAVRSDETGTLFTVLLPRLASKTQG